MEITSRIFVFKVVVVDELGIGVYHTESFEGLEVRSGGNREGKAGSEHGCRK
jgi:hypothetical protein